MTSVLEQAGVDDSNIKDVTSYIDEAGFESSQDEVHYWAVAAYIFIAVDIVMVLVLIFLSSRIRIAVGIIREASKAVRTMPLLILFPLIPTLSVIALVVYWLVTAAYIATSGKITFSDIEDQYSDGETFTLGEYSNDNIMNYMLVYHLFGLLWTNQFLQALGYMTIAGAVAEYYWTLDKTSIQRVPVFRSFYRVLRYHLGTLAFGSLIIAIVQAVRIALEYLDHKTKDAQEGNKFVKVVMTCCKCFLWLFEQCLKFINKYVFFSGHRVTC